MTILPMMVIAATAIICASAMLTASRAMVPYKARKTMPTAQNGRLVSRR